MAKSESKTESKYNPHKDGFRLLKPGKSIAGTRHKRGKDITIFEDGKRSALKNITKKSYVPSKVIKDADINLKHFEDKIFDEIPVID